MPDAADPLQRAQIVTALSVGSEIINLRRIAPQLGFGPELDAALAALAEGDSAAANARLAALDRRLGSLPERMRCVREHARNNHAGALACTAFPLKRCIMGVSNAIANQHATE